MILYGSPFRRAGPIDLHSRRSGTRREVAQQPSEKGLERAGNTPFSPTGHPDHVRVLQGPDEFTPFGPA